MHSMPMVMPSRRSSDPASGSAFDRQKSTSLSISKPQSVVAVQVYSQEETHNIALKSLLCVKPSSDCL